MDKRRLTGCVALVAGATRGAGRGISVELGAAGATMYCSGRSVRGETMGLVPHALAVTTGHENEGMR